MRTAGPFERLWTYITAVPIFFLLVFAHIVNRIHGKGQIH